MTGGVPVSSNSDQDRDQGLPIAELKDHTVAPHPDLGDRVRRSINLHSLAADSLDLSLNVLPRTVWEYLRSLLESLPGIHRQKKE